MATETASQNMHDATPRLLATARRQGKVDSYTGKRRWTRYKIGLRLDVSRDPTNRNAAWSVTTHNISGGGIAFWSKKPVDTGSTIHIQDLVERGAGAWIPAKVAHCTMGLRGYLVGATFEQPTSSDEEAINPQSDALDQRDQVVDGTPARHLRSLRTKSALAAAAGGGFAALLACATLYFTPAGVDPTTRLTIAIASAVLCGALGGWLVLGPEVRCLRLLQNLIRRLADGRADTAQSIDAPSREFEDVRRAVLGLNERWLQRQDEDRLQCQRLEELTQMKSNILAVVSHDLRTPLTSILLYAQMLSEEMDTLATEDRTSFLGIITEECNRLSRLVDDLLEVQRLESGRVRMNIQPRDIAATIRACLRVFEALAESKSITLTVNCPATLPRVEADSDKIAQVISNLVSNAIKYTQQGGEVEVDVEPRGNEIVICVADNGPGIPRDKWDQIFDRFRQLADPDVTDVQGFGLGLHIVKKIIEAHDGKVWVDSEVGLGSAFYVAIPTQAARPTTAAKGRPTMPARRILVCDPDPALAATVAQALRSGGHDVRVVNSGHRLLSQLQQGDVDVVVTDVLLPDIDAAELLDSLMRKTDRTYRVVVHSYADDSEALLERGVDVFLQRPVDKDELLQAVQSTINGRSKAAVTVLLVGGDPAFEQLSSLLGRGGCPPMTAADLDDAATTLDKHQIDLAFVSEQLLTSDWHELSRLGWPRHQSTTVVVLCADVGRRERNLGNQHNVTAHHFQPGREESVLEMVAESRESRTECVL